MATSNTSPRPLREIAKQASEEPDPNKVIELAEELIHALDANSRKIMDNIETAERTHEKGAA